MTRFLKLIVLLAAFLIWVSPALAEKTEDTLPPQVVGTNTMLAAYVDMTQISPNVIDQLGDVFLSLANNEMLKDQGVVLPIGDPQQIVDMLALLRGPFLQAGGEGLAMTVEMPGEDSWSAPIMMSAKTNDKFDAPSMAAMVRSMGGAETEATIESLGNDCLLYTSPSPRDQRGSRMPSSA